MSDAELLLLVETRKKSALVAALLNVLVPGAGYIYCGRWILGIFAFLIVVVLFVVSLGFLAGFLLLVLVIDGLLCARRYNKRVIAEALEDARSRRGFADQPTMGRVIQHELPALAVDTTPTITMPNIGESELHITCRKCGRIRVMHRDEVTPFEYHRLKCTNCGERDPKVSEHEPNMPFTPGFKPWRG